MAPPIKTDSALSSLPGYFQMRQPRAADMQPSAPQSSGFSSPSATESAFRVLASNPPDVTKSATFSTPPQNAAIQGPSTVSVAPGFIANPTPRNPAIQGQASAPNLPAASPTPAYTSAGDNVPKGGTGGSGFVGFSQYFGANAPSVQAQAQKAAVGAKDMGALNALQSAGSVAASPFDAMLGQGATERAAAQAGQNRFKQLASRLNTATPQEAQAISKASEASYNSWLNNLPTQYKYNNTPEQLRAMYEDDKRAGTAGQKTQGMVTTPGSSL
jgi:hypothetical protein